MRTSRLCSLWPDMRPLRFRRVPFGRDVAFDPGGATASCIAMPHMLPSTVPSVSASAKFFLSWLNPTPHPITVYASHPPSPTTAQHSLPGGALPPYRCRSFTGRIASASPDAPEQKPHPRHDPVAIADAQPALDQVQLEAADVVSCRRVGRAPQERGEAPAAVDVASLRMAPQLAGSHILDHPLAQRADGGISAHGELLLSEVANTSSSSGRGSPLL